MHQETGRNIYVGGIFLEQNTPTADDLAKVSGPRRMEYRVVARRTSIRSLLGGILLQSELASGQAPSDNVARFANEILSTVEGSLYAGDNFAIELNENSETIALLNDRELTRIDDDAVSDYMLAGWIGEQGPSTDFRTSITAEAINSTLLSTFEQTVFSTARTDQVATWVEKPVAASSAAAEIATTTAPSAQFAAIPAPSVDSVRDVIEEQPSAVPSSASGPALAPVTAATVATVAPSPTANSKSTPKSTYSALQQEPIAKPGLAIVAAPVQTDATQVASLLPTAGLTEASAGDIVEALDVKDYSRRLAEFNNGVIRKVYSQIRYPTRAIRRGLQGRVELDVTLLESGELVDITVTRSSGYKILDQAAVAAAGKALASLNSEELVPVAVAEFGEDDDRLIVPVPVQFMLTE